VEIWFVDSPRDITGLTEVEGDRGKARGDRLSRICTLFHAEEIRYGDLPACRQSSTSSRGWIVRPIVAYLFADSAP